MPNIWGIFIGFLENVILTLSNLTHSSGLGIILFTIAVRLLTLPFTIIALQEMRRRQEAQPLIDELKRRYGNDRRKIMHETVLIYREHKVNTLSGSIPIILQLVTLIGVFQAVKNLTQISVAEQVAKPMLQVLGNSGFNVAAIAQSFGASHLNDGFLWLTNLGTPDTTGILPITTALLLLIVQLMSMPQEQNPQQKNMAWAMLLMPLVFGYFGFTFASGVTLYMAADSLVSLILQYRVVGWGALPTFVKLLPIGRRERTAPVAAPPLNPAGVETIPQDEG